MEHDNTILNFISECGEYFENMVIKLLLKLNLIFIFDFPKFTLFDQRKIIFKSIQIKKNVMKTIFPCTFSVSILKYLPVGSSFKRVTIIFRILNTYSDKCLTP